MFRKLFGKKKEKPTNETPKSNITPKNKVSFDKQVERNLKGKELESQGKVEEAKELYLANVSEGFEGNHPYDRLAIIYRKEKAIDKEIEVLEKAIHVFETKVNKERGDRQPKLEKFKTRLEKAKQLQSKE